MSVAAQLWAENQDLAARAVTHPFVRGLADGTLPGGVFARYVAQDAWFLETFARAYALAAAHSADRTTLEAFVRLLDGVVEELALHDGYCTKLGIDLPAIPPTAVTLAYCDFLLATAALGSIAHTCAAMTPCMRLYAHLGTTLSGSAAPTYATWVDTYADTAFHQLAQSLEDLLDTHTPDADEVRGLYRRAMEMEIAFFDAVLTPPHEGVPGGRG